MFVASLDFCDGKIKSDFKLIFLKVRFGGFTFENSDIDVVDVVSSF